MSQDTLRFQLNRPLCLQRDMSLAPMSPVCANLRMHVQKFDSAKVKPEDAAVRFYMLNHAVALIRQQFDIDEPVSPVALAVLNAYHQEMNELSVRMFAYLGIICTRETRHGSKTAELKKQLIKLFGVECVSFHWAKVAKVSSGAAKGAFLNPSVSEEVKLGDYCNMLANIFYNPKSHYGGGFGGKKWGVIADVLTGFVHGKLSAEMMLDTAFTLAHNGGPIFNKGTCFTMYDKGTIMKVLDTQASGQIPELVNECGTNGLAHFLGSRTLVLHKLCKKVHPATFNGYVDWFKVSAGAKAGNKYTSEKNDQTAKHGQSEFAGQEEKIKAAKIKAAKEQVLLEKAEWSKTHFTVMPGVNIDKVSREAA